jgi:hypothetical protein
MKNTFLLTKVARSMLVASVVLGITGAAYAQIGGGGAAGIGVGSVGSGGIPGQAGPASGAAEGQAGGEMSGMSKALPGLGQESSMREQGVPGLGNSVERRSVGRRSVEPRSMESRAGTALEPDFPPGKQRAAGASSRMKASDWAGGESTGMGVGSRD